MSLEDVRQHEDERYQLHSDERYRNPVLQVKTYIYIVSKKRANFGKR